MIKRAKNSLIDHTFCFQTSITKIVSVVDRFLQKKNENSFIKYTRDAWVYVIFFWWGDSIIHQLFTLLDRSIHKMKKILENLSFVFVQFLRPLFCFCSILNVQLFNCSVDSVNAIWSKTKIFLSIAQNETYALPYERNHTFRYYCEIHSIEKIDTTFRLLLILL